MKEAGTINFLWSYASGTHIEMRAPRILPKEKRAKNRLIFRVEKLKSSFNLLARVG